MNVLRQHADSVNGLEQKVTEMENEGTLSLDYEKLAKDILELIEDREKGNLTLTRPIGLPPHAPVAQKVTEQCSFIASLVKRLFARVDWTERLRDDSSTTD